MGMSDVCLVRVRHVHAHRLTLKMSRSPPSRHPLGTGRARLTGPRRGAGQDPSAGAAPATGRCRPKAPGGTGRIGCCTDAGPGPPAPNAGTRGCAPAAPTGSRRGPPATTGREQRRRRRRRVRCLTTPAWLPGGGRSLYATGEGLRFVGPVAASSRTLAALIRPKSWRRPPPLPKLRLARHRWLGKAARVDGFGTAMAPRSVAWSHCGCPARRADG